MNAILRILLGLFASAVVLVVHAQTMAYAPYRQTEVNAAYNRLFCDAPGLYKNPQRLEANNAWHALFVHPVDLTRLQGIAGTPANDSCLRLLAFHILQQHKRKPKQRILLGIIIEVGQAHGMVSLAAYRDRRVRYIGHTGKMKDMPKPDAEIAALVRKLFREAQPIIEKIGPWPKGRLSPPAAGVVRMSFLVSDGLYFGQGSMSTLARSPLAGPVLTAATELLFKVTKH